MTIGKRALLGLVAAVGALVALPAAASIIIENTPVASPIASTGFETFTLAAPNTDYVDGGVAVRYVSADPDDFALNSIPYALSNPDGSGSWGMIQNHGYTSARLQSGGAFNTFSGLFGSEWPDGHLLIEFVLGGSVFDTLDAGSLTTVGSTYSFSGFTADEVRFQSPQFNTFGSTGDEIGVDDLAFGVSTGVPEPATWVLLIGGFGLMGVSLRRNRAIEQISWGRRDRS